MTTRLERNKALVLEAMTSLFQRKDPLAVERLYAAEYIQHNPTIPQGREALAKLVAQLPSAVFYEPGLIIAEGDYVAIHGRIRGWAPSPQVVVDIFRVEGGRLTEHWDVLQDETPVEEAKAGIAMFSPDEATVQAATNRAISEAPVNYDGVLQANLERVFGEHDADRRIEAIRELYAEGAVLYEPHASVSGHAAISEAVTVLLASLPPHFVFRAAGPAVGHNGVGRLQWRAGPPDGPVAVTGTDVALFDNGLIRSLHVFLDPIGA
ncbi:nuclear transport factor 2 family protein [Polaromonas sp. P1(28)-8]|nr:nuclear transport factor 2 family protein [Polaromonas sp. P1(28)-8]